VDNFRDYLPRRGPKPKEAKAVEVLPYSRDCPLKAVEALAETALLQVLQEIDQFCEFDDGVLQLVAPHDFTPGRSEGVCALTKRILDRCGSTRIGQEMLRTLVVLADSQPLTPEEREY